MPGTRPVGISVLSAALALLGISALVSNLSTTTLELNRVPQWVEFYGVIYGIVALVAATLLFQMSRYSRGALGAWALLALGVIPMLWSQVDQPLLLAAPTVLLLAVVYVADQYVRRATGRAAS